MNHNIVMISNPSYLSIKNNCLKIQRTDDEKLSVSLSFEDFNILMINNIQSTLTTSVLTKIADNKNIIIFCNEKQLPQSITIPIYSQYNEVSILKKQLNISKPVLSQIWKIIINNKIENQMFVLHKYNKTKNIESIKIHQSRIQSGDKTNIEAVTSRLYFKSVFHNSFIRNQNANENDIINIALNYGYTIIMSICCRYLCIYGFNLNIGIFHNSSRNSFNLACDIMEPFRFVVDDFILSKLNDCSNFVFNNQLKKDLIDYISNSKFLIDDIELTLHVAIKEIVISFQQSILGNSSSCFKICKML